ncbi:bd13ab7d-bdb2-47c9-997f-87d28a234d2a-CDS [Sclerotinia trifoliorum]|uniref:Bd13ab7d-bdb2-47c9-997f-87d28a234d2a-CDS n=1 Tax=Sclerotinia trifoliorum TaxID=28548 RepID=A0A8H2W459_9HELO|nr:bd13ab7d-bdb2-47c9-997f-87d28a234d2a-CDS [Sclerotinia trifoliorum]
MLMSHAPELDIEKDAQRWIAFLELFIPFLAWSIDKETKFFIQHEGCCLTARHVAKYFRPVPKNLRVRKMIWRDIQKANLQYESRLLDYSG